MLAQALELFPAADERRAAAGGEEGGVGVELWSGGRGGGWRRGVSPLGVQQPLELRLDLRPGRDAELVAQQRAQPLVYAQRLDEVALRLAHAHQQ